MTISRSCGSFSSTYSSSSTSSSRSVSIASVLWYWLNRGKFILTCFPLSCLCNDTERVTTCWISKELNHPIICFNRPSGRQTVSLLTVCAKIQLFILYQKQVFYQISLSPVQQCQSCYLWWWSILSLYSKSLEPVFIQNGRKLFEQLFKHCF